MSEEKVSISQRINSRKILLSCLYEIFFAGKICSAYEKIGQEEEKKEKMKEMISEEDKIVIPGDFGVFEKKLTQEMEDYKEEVEFQDTREISREEYQTILTKVREKKSESYHDILEYQLQFAYEAWKVKKVDTLPSYSFEEWKEKEIDLTYLEKMLEKSFDYAEEVHTKVNQYVTTFKYEEMDLMDQAIFLLGYTESLVFHTPKEVLINEMVELTKRYSRDGASKVIHGILHYLIEN